MMDKRQTLFTEKRNRKKMREIKVKPLIGEPLPQENCIMAIWHEDFLNEPEQCTRKKQEGRNYCWQHPKGHSKRRKT